MEEEEKDPKDGKEETDIRAGGWWSSFTPEKRSDLLHDQRGKTAPTCVSDQIPLHRYPSDILDHHINGQSNGS